jgi:hypothetical protein
MWHIAARQNDAVFGIKYADNFCLAFEKHWKITRLHKKLDKNQLVNNNWLVTITFHRSRSPALYWVIWRMTMSYDTL